MKFFFCPSKNKICSEAKVVLLSTDVLPLFAGAAFIIMCAPERAVLGSVCEDAAATRGSNEPEGGADIDL